MKKFYIFHYFQKCSSLSCLHRLSHSYPSNNICADKVWYSLLFSIVVQKLLQLYKTPSCSFIIMNMDTVVYYVSIKQIPCGSLIRTKLCGWNPTAANMQHKDTTLLHGCTGGALQVGWFQTTFTEHRLIFFFFFNNDQKTWRSFWQITTMRVNSCNAT